MAFQPGQRISVGEFLDPSKNIQENLIRRALGQPEIQEEQQAPQVDMNRIAELERKAQLYDTQVKQGMTRDYGSVDDFLIKYPTQQEPQRMTTQTLQAAGQPQVSAAQGVESAAPQQGVEQGKSGDMFDGLMNLFGDKPSATPEKQVASDRIEGYDPQRQQQVPNAQMQPQGQQQGQAIPQEIKSTIDGINEFNTRIFNLSREKGYNPKDVAKFMADAFGTPESVMELYAEYVSAVSTNPISQQQTSQQMPLQGSQQPLRNPALEALQSGPSLVKATPATGTIDVDSQYNLLGGDLRV